MKRRLLIPTLSIVLAPLALGVTSVRASGGDDQQDNDEQEQEGPTPSTPSSTVTTSVPNGSLPSGGNRVAEIRSRLQKALNKVNQSAMPEAVKAEMRARITALITMLESGQRIDSGVLESLSKAIEDASKGRRPNGSIPGTSQPTRPSSSIGTGSDSADDDNDSADDDDADDDSSDDSNDDERHGEGRRDLASNITRAIEALNLLPESEARDAALSSLAALQVRLDAGETVPTNEVRAVFRAVAALVYERIGEDPDDEESPERSEMPTEMTRQRLLGSITQALALLDGNTSDAAVAAVAALQAVKATLDAGETPTRDDVENAMRLTREALHDVPGSHAVVTLAGVIAAITASDMPDDVKAHLLEVLGEAKDRIQTDPSVDPKQIVRDALNEVRQQRIAAMVSKMLEIATRLENAATTVGNAEAQLLITEARTLLQPSDGSLPDRDDLHHARRILVRVAIMLRGSTTPDSTIPTTTVPEEPSTTVI